MASIRTIVHLFKLQLNRVFINEYISLLINKITIYPSLCFSKLFNKNKRKEVELMISKQIHNIRIHQSKVKSNFNISESINEFHSRLIERKLNQTNLTNEQKIDVINSIIENLKSREINTIID